MDFESGRTDERTEHQFLTRADLLLGGVVASMLGLALGRLEAELMGQWVAHLLKSMAPVYNWPAAGLFSTCAALSTWLGCTVATNRIRGAFFAGTSASRRFVAFTHQNVASVWPTVVFLAGSALPWGILMIGAPNLSWTVYSFWFAAATARVLLTLTRLRTVDISEHASIGRLFGKRLAITAVEQVGNVVRVAAGPRYEELFAWRGSRVTEEDAQDLLRALAAASAAPERGGSFRQGAESALRATVQARVPVATYQENPGSQEPLPPRRIPPTFATWWDVINGLLLGLIGWSANLLIAWFAEAYEIGYPLVAPRFHHLLAVPWVGAVAMLPLLFRVAASVRLSLRTSTEQPKRILAFTRRSALHPAFLFVAASASIGIGFLTDDRTVGFAYIPIVLVALYQALHAYHSLRVIDLANPDIHEIGGASSRIQAVAVHDEHLVLRVQDRELPIYLWHEIGRSPAQLASLAGMLSVEVTTAKPEEAVAP